MFKVGDIVFTNFIPYGIFTSGEVTKTTKGALENTYDVKILDTKSPLYGRTIFSAPESSILSPYSNIIMRSQSKYMYNLPYNLTQEELDALSRLTAAGEECETQLPVGNQTEPLSTNQDNVNADKKVWNGPNTVVTALYMTNQVVRRYIDCEA